MPPGHSYISRWLMLACLVLGLAGATITTSSSPTLAQSATTAASAPLDLAAIALNPLDLAAFGLQPYGIGDARHVDAGNAANLIAETHQQPSDSYASLLTDNGLVRGYTLTNDNLTPPDAAGADLNGFVQTTTLEVPDVAAATTIFAAITDWSSASQVAVVSADAGVGSASQVVSLSTGGGEGPGYEMLQITFQRDNIVGWVTFAARVLPTNASDLIGSLGSRLAEKLGIIAGGNAPDISYRALTLENTVPKFGAYVTAYGGTLRLVAESESDVQQRAAAAGDLQSDFRQSTILPANAGVDTYDTELLAFADDGASSLWVADSLQRLQQTPGVVDPVVAPDANPIGDDSITLTYQTERGQHGRQITAQSGASVLTIRLVGDQSILPQQLDILAAAQLSCLTVDAICVPVALQNLSVAGSPGSPPAPVQTPSISPQPTQTMAPMATTAPNSTATSTSSPQSVATSAASPEMISSSPSPASSPVASPAVATTTYQNPDYPFSVTYDSLKWRIEQQGAANERSFVLLTNDTSLIYLIAGKTYGDDVGACVKDAAQSLATETGVTDVSPAVDSGGKLLEGSSDRGAFTVYTYNTANGIPAARYFECVVLVPGESTLLVMQIVAQRSFNDQVDERLNLLKGLHIGTAP